MTAVSEALTSMVVDNLLTQAKRTSANIIIGRSIIALSLFFFALGLVLWIYAGYLWFSVKYSHIHALYYTGAVSVLIALLIALFMVLALKYRDMRIKKARDEIFHRVEDFKALLDEEIGSSIRENPKMSLLIATISGALLEDVRRSENKTLSQVLPITRVVEKLVG